MPIVILDRDGVINFDSPDFIKSPDEWRPIPGSVEAVARLSKTGWNVYIATNQSGVGRGLMTAANLEAIHEKLHSTVRESGGRINGVFFCPHAPNAGCDCRKPLPGLLHQIAAATGESIVDVPVVGDSMRDIEAARAAGAKPILVLTGNGATTKKQLRGDDVEIFDDLASLVDTLLDAE